MKDSNRKATYLAGCIMASIALPFTVVAQQSDQDLDDLIGPTSEPAPSDTPPAAEPAPAPEAAPAATASEAAKSAEVSPAPAPEAAPSKKAPRRASNRLVEEIVVTAQKREENIQDVPIAITAFSPEKLDAIGIKTVQDLERATPGLTISNAGGYSVAYLRGIGTDAFLAGADPSVPYYLDGVALLGTQGSSDSLGRIARIEVLKGPQGTLFGRNATGGAISIITPDPGPEVSGDLKIERAQYDIFNATLFANLPLSESVGMTVSGFYQSQDNFYTNDLAGAPPTIDIFARGARAKLRWQALEDLTFTLAGSYAEASTNAGLTFENTRVARVFTGTIKQDPSLDRHIRADQLNGAQVVSRLNALTTEWKLSVLDTRLIVSDQRLTSPFVQADFDASEDPIASFTSIRQVNKQRSAELQFLSNAATPLGDVFKWVGGLYYIEASGGYDPLQLRATRGLFDKVPTLGGPLAALLSMVSAPGVPAFADGIRLNSHGISDARAISTYFQGTYNFTDTLNLTVGARYQIEKRDLKNAKVDIVNSDGSTTNFRRDEVPTLKAYQLSPKVALQWIPFEAAQVYGSWSRGYKSPTYNTVNFFDTPEAVREERVDSFEVGLKSDLFDGALRLNGAAFYVQQKDLLTGIVALASGGVVTYQNAGNAVVKGAEADAIWSPLPVLNPGLALNGAITYLNARYTSYRDGSGFDEDSGLAFGPGASTQMAGRDFTGNKIVRSPTLTLALGINQAIPLGDGSLEFGADTYFNSGFFLLPQNSKFYKRDRYQLFNARVSYLYEPAKVRLTGYVDNFTDEEYSEVVFVDDFGRNQGLNAPRTFGIRMNWTF